jgi:hypothetical protein
VVARGKLQITAMAEKRKKSEFSNLLHGFKTRPKTPKKEKSCAVLLEEVRLGGVFSGQELSGDPQVQRKTVWTFWHEGEDRLPSFYAMCVNSWRRRLDASWDVRVLNLVENHKDNIFHLLSLDELSNRFMEICLRQHQVKRTAMHLLIFFC